MRYRIRWSPAAQRDLEAVWDDALVASEDAGTAGRYVSEFIDRIGELAEFPDVGFSLVYRGLFTGFRSVNFKAYKAFYRVKAETVDIIRILPAKSDYIKVIFGEE